MPKMGKRFSKLMTMVRILKNELKGKVKGVEVIQNFAECPIGDDSFTPYIIIEYNAKYYYNTNESNLNHPDNIIQTTMNKLGIIKLFRLSGKEIQSGKRDIGFILKSKQLV